MSKNERELGDALLKLDAAALAAAPDAKQQAERVLQRDRRRLRWWTVLTILAWLPAVLCILAVLVNLGLLFPLQAKLTRVRQDQKAGTVPAGDVYVHEGRKLDLAQLERDADAGFKMMAVLTGLSVLALAGATLFSVVLISSSRRATLRQINASLLEIAQQLKRSPSSARRPQAWHGRPGPAFKAGKRVPRCLSPHEPVEERADRDSKAAVGPVAAGLLIELIDLGQRADAGLAVIQRYPLADVLGDDPFDTPSVELLAERPGVLSRVLVRSAGGARGLTRPRRASAPVL